MSPLEAPIRALPADEQEVLVLHSFYRLTRDEVAAVVGLPVARVEALLRRAVEDLRTCLAPVARRRFAV